MLKNIFRNIRIKYYKIKYRNNVRFFPNSKIDKNCFFEGYNSLGERSILSNCYIGMGSYISTDTNLSKVKIGRYSSLGSSIRNTRGRHPISQFVSTYPGFFSPGNKVARLSFTTKKKFEELKFNADNYLVTIGNDVWIGDNVTILDGITVGDGAIIGSGAVVTKDVEPYSINVGVPSKRIKFRFNHDDIEFLLKYEWWNKNISELNQISDIFDDIFKFRHFVDNQEKNNAK